MRITMLAVAVSLVPVLAAAQQDPPKPKPEVKAEAQAQADVQAEPVLAKFSAEHRAKLEAALKDAKAKSLPTKPLLDRMNEGRAKGAADAEIVTATEATVGRLETAHRALVSGGRAQPDEREVGYGAMILERGATSAQLESVIRTAPADRSLVVAFEVLTKLTERGLPVDNALAQVSGKLVARAPDGEIASLVSTLGMKGGKPNKP